MLFAFAVQAQYIPNSDFERWESAGSSYQSSDGGYGMRTRPGNEPTSWEGSSVNQKVSGVEKKETLISSSTSYNGSTSVKMINKWVGANILGIKIGDEAPGFISFATPWVYAVKDVNSCDGGVYGGLNFSYRPDAIKGRFKRSGGTGEKAHIIVYLWNGTFKNAIKSKNSNDVQNNTDRAVMGRVSSTDSSGKRIASCDYEFTSTNDWEEINIPLNYNSDEVPQMMNVILSSGDYWNRNNIKDGSILEADDVQFVYYSELASLKFNGKEYFVNGTTSYTIDEVYNPDKLVVVSNGKGASVERKLDYASNVLTVTIKGGDYSQNSSNKHEYTIKFKEAKSELASLVFKGQNYFLAGSTTFNIDEYYDENALQITSDGENAMIERSFDKLTNVLTITIKGEDYAANPNSKHVYTVNFRKSKSELASLLYNGQEYYEVGKTSYNIDKVYNEAKIQLIPNGDDAVVEKVYDASSCVLTITVKGGDYALNDKSVHVYTVRFLPDPGVAYSELLSLVYRGKEYYEFGRKVYVIDEVYNPKYLKVVSNGSDATIELDFDESSSILTITIKGRDYEEDNSNVHVYMAAFKKETIDPAPVPAPDAELASLVYNGNEYFAQGTVSFVIDELYDESLLQTAANYEDATVEYAYDDTTAVLSITVKGSDYPENYGNIRVYKVAFKKKVLNAELTSLVYDGEDYFVEGETSYVIDAVYERSKLSYTLNVEDAVVRKEYDKSLAILTITVKGTALDGDENKETVYTVQFKSETIGVPVFGASLSSIADADANKMYVLYNETYTAYAVYNPEHEDVIWVAGMRGDNQDHQLKNSEYSAPLDTTSVNSSWKVINHGNGKYSLYNVGAGKYLTTPEYESGTDRLFACSFTSDVVQLSVVELGSSKFAFNATSNSKSYMCAAPQLDAPVSVWESSDAGSAWKLIENPSVKPDEIDYTPAFTGTKTTVHAERLIHSITLTSDAYSDEEGNVLNVDNSGKLCYNDYTGTVVMKAVAGEELSVEVNIGEGSWIHSYVYIDTDENGFTASIAGDGYSPLGDLVSYSFYNNGDSSDSSGRNSEGKTMSGDSRSTVSLPSFTAPEIPGVYRMRVKIDWCNIDPMGDRDGKFGDFMANGGQIVDFMLKVVDEEIFSDIEDVETENETVENNAVVEGIYDMQGRKIDEITKPGIYIINGKKVLVK